MVTPLVKTKIVKKHTARFIRHQSDRFHRVKVPAGCDARTPMRRPPRSSAAGLMDAARGSPALPPVCCSNPGGAPRVSTPACAGSSRDAA